MFNRLSRRRREEFEYQALAHLNTLIRAALQLCPSREEAEDAVQETYLQAWKYWNTFQSGTNCRAWLFRILFNVLKKKPRRDASVETAIEEMTADNVLSFQPDRTVEAYEVLEVFEQLEEEHRAVLMLVAVEDMSYKDAALALGVPVGTVMSRVNRARAELRCRLGRTKRAGRFPTQPKGGFLRT